MGLVTSNEDPSVRATHPSAKKRVRLRSLLSCFSPVDSNMAKSKRFVIGKPIGVGSFGKVNDCVDTSSGRHYAVKILHQRRGTRKEAVSRLRFMSEVAILSAADHRNIVKLHDYYEDNQNFYCVLEKCEGNGLGKHIYERKFLDEASAASLCRQMLDALAYLHSRNIMHRDIKAENFMFETKDKSARLILLDFGISAIVNPSAPLRKICGSPHYLSPEMLRRSYSFPADMWSLGVLVFVMLYGRYPFQGPSSLHVCKSILHNEVNYFAGPSMPSSLGIEFVSALLEVDQEKRLTAQEALQHRWITQRDEEGSEDCTKTTMSGLVRASSDDGEEGTESVRHAYRQCSFPCRIRETQTKADIDADSTKANKLVLHEGQVPTQTLCTASALCFCGHHCLPTEAAGKLHQAR
ncbi:LOW QUALITY PROTEIN: CAM kinase (incomplete catalytic triad), putative [Eimeria necatrix]|uniref:CAM kinase (Incomplete catalytic triad), putative n=1 Tax=Eimeria necatrix TaxID=51315 RepID=U6MKB0_9EIME|nr:LOW QUALITY PROTEIN: CAM kinase (incomplete catalytic triad), putative [Eimeria necatrix]CDJ64667.1 CAM kinase (incomplete catalytic triad), putative [Eimeria necatrix]